MSDRNNTVIAFALVLGAGASTAIGASVVFFPLLVKLANRRTLAAALGLSAGVMTYVSFVEIFGKSFTSFVNGGLAENIAYSYATVCFFAGVVLMVILNYCVTSLLGGHHHHHHHHDSEEDRRCGEKRTRPVSDDAEDESKHAAAPPCVCCSDDPTADLRLYQQMAREIGEYQQQEHHDWEGVEEAHHHHHHHDSHDNHEDNNDDAEQQTLEEQPQQATKEQKDESVRSSVVDEPHQNHDDDDAKKLMRMSINTALAIGLHNFPEGLATFVAALADPSVGVVLAVAIAIHNIPEGLCVALPIYYATGNKCKAFLWGCLSGVAEPIAALLGWAILAAVFSDTVYAVLFGLVAGMMVIISTKELLPTAHRYDPEDSVVTYSFMVGMAIMALSLVLFQL